MKTIKYNKLEHTIWEIGEVIPGTSKREIIVYSMEEAPYLLTLYGFNNLQELTELCTASPQHLISFGLIKKQ